VDPDLMASALLRWAEVRFEAGAADDVDAVERGRALLTGEPRRTADGDLTAESLRAHAISWQWAAAHDDLALALRGAIADLQRHRDLGMDRPMPIIEAEVAYLLAWAGDHAGASHHAQAAMEAAGLVGTREGRSAALGAIGVAAVLDGDLDAAVEAARAGLDMAADPPDWLDARHEANLGAAALAAGDARKAAAVLGDLFDRFVALGARDATTHRIAGDLVEAAVAAGDLSRARSVVEVLEASTKVAPQPWVAVMALRGRALVQAAEGDLDAAARTVAAALEAAAGLPMPVERGRTELIAGRIARRRKEKRRAAEHLDRAVGDFRAVGAGAWLAIAEADQARLGRRRGGNDELTETEARVARLAAAGMTNREVGEAAFLTPKSVEGVLGRVYAKLGIRSRAELGAWLAGQDGLSAAKTGPHDP
jgi:DNA-binding CsgD family transcriptional regulator